MEQIEDHSVKEGELLTAPYKEKFFEGSDPYEQFLNWVNFTRPSQLEVRAGKLNGELAIRVVYVK